MQPALRPKGPRVRSVTEHLPFIGASLAAIATLVGIFTAVDQLTLSARLRRLEAWARAAEQGETDDARKAALREIQSVATARLVGAAYVPAVYFLEFILWALLAPVLTVTQFAKSSPWGERLSSAGFTTVVLALVLRRAVRLYLERQRVAREYLDGQAIKPPGLDILHQMEGGTRREFRYAVLFAVVVTTASVCVGMLLSGNTSVWPFAVLVAVTLLGWSPFRYLRAQSVTARLRTKPVA